MPTYTLGEGIFCKGAVKSKGHWKKRHFTILASNDGGGKLQYRGLTGTGNSGTSAATVEGLTLKRMKEVTIVSNDSAADGWDAGIKPPSCWGMPGGLWKGAAASAASNRASIRCEQDDGAHVMEYFAESEENVMIINMLTNACDLRKHDVASMKLLQAFLVLTDNRGPMQYIGIKGSTTSLGVPYSSTTVLQKKNWPRSTAHYNYRSKNPAEIPHFHLFYQPQQKEPPRWCTSRKKNQRAESIAVCYYRGTSGTLKDVDAVWHKGGWSTDFIDGGFEHLSSIRINFGNVLQAMLICMKKAQSVAKFCGVAIKNKSVEKLVQRLTYKHPGSPAGEVPKILSVLNRLGEHATGEDVPRATEILVGDHVLSQVLDIVKRLETGEKGAPCSSSVYVGGRGGYNSCINGWYTKVAEFNGRQAYFKPEKRPKREPDEGLFLYWQESDSRWVIAKKMGASSLFARAHDNVHNAEAIAAVWNVWVESEDGREDDFYQDNNVLVTPQRGHVHTYKNELFEVLHRCTSNPKLCEKIAVHGSKSSRHLLRRAIVRLKGVRLAGMNGSKLKAQEEKRDDVVDHMITILADVAMNRFEEGVNTKKVSDAFFEPGRSKDSILTLMMDLFMVGTEPTFVETQKRKRKDGMKPVILDTLRCDIGHVLRCIAVPISFRNSKDPRAEAIRARLIKEVTPRLAQLVDELADESKNTDIFSMYLDKFKAEYAITLLAHLCGFKEASECVATQSPDTLRKVMTILSSGVTTGMDRLTKVASMTSTSAGTMSNRLPAAYCEVLALVSEFAKHLDDSHSREAGDEDRRVEPISEVLFRIDPVPTLIQVLEVGASDMAKLLAAESMFWLARHDTEHCESIFINKGLPALLNLLRTGSNVASQNRAAGALSAVVKDSKKRQEAFASGGGCRALVRLLEKYGSGGSALEDAQFARFLATITLHLTTVDESAGAVVDSGVIPVLLKLLQNKRGDELDIDTQIHIAQCIQSLCYTSGFLSQLQDANAMAVLDKVLKKLGHVHNYAPVVIPDNELEDKRLQFNVKLLAGMDESTKKKHFRGMVEWSRIYLENQAAPAKPGSCVFIAYHKKDKGQAKLIHSALNPNTYNVIDLNVALSLDVSKITQAIDKSFVVIVCCSRHFQDVEEVTNCRGLLETAAVKRRALIPVILDDNFQPGTWLLPRIAGVDPILMYRDGMNKSSLRRLRDQIDGLKQSAGAALAQAKPAVEAPPAYDAPANLRAAAAAAPVPVESEEVLPPIPPRAPRRSGRKSSSTAESTTDPDVAGFGFEADLMAASGIDTTEFEWPEDGEPDVIVSYCTRTLGGQGKKYAWALANAYKKQHVACFHGAMFKGGQNWKTEWFGKLPSAKVAVLMLSPAYWSSPACINELTAICRSNLDGTCILPIYLETMEGPMEGNFPAGNFLEDCELGIADEEKEKRLNLFKVTVSGNMIPPPDQGTFADNFAKNADTLVKRTRQIIWG
mmetsp:Transcript_11267/g.33794  ORF Transcript_11267/g.33794 Transcript_11267/m.33794 type:complete len:1470 (+) Transcript_11267:163-4572(+)